MKDYAKTIIARRLEWLKEQKEMWEHYRSQGSNDLTYALTCEAKILEAEAEMHGLEYALDAMGYRPVYADNILHGYHCELAEKE